MIMKNRVFNVLIARLNYFLKYPSIFFQLLFFSVLHCETLDFLESDPLPDIEALTWWLITFQLSFPFQ